MKHTRLAWGIRFAKVVAVLMVIGAGVWIIYAVHWHYRHMGQCSCIISWEVMPFIASGIAVLFALALLALKETEGAAAVVLPFVKEIQIGRRASDTAAVIIPDVNKISVPNEQEVKPDV